MHTALFVHSWQVGDTGVVGGTIARLYILFVTLAVVYQGQEIKR